MAASSFLVPFNGVAVLVHAGGLWSRGGNVLRKAVDGVDTVSRGVGGGGANKDISASYVASKSDGVLE
jgi:hypothetical protein